MTVEEPEGFLVSLVLLEELLEVSDATIDVLDEVAVPELVDWVILSVPVDDEASLLSVLDDELEVRVVIVDRVVGGGPVVAPVNPLLLLTVIEEKLIVIDSNIAGGV